MTAVEALTISDLVASYDRSVVLHGISLSVGAGEIVALLGANGAGKTTTLRTISGLVKSSGQLQIAGKQVLGMPPEKITRMGVGHVPQGRGTFPNLTAEENLRAGALTRRVRDVAADIEQWYEMFPQLRERAQQRAGHLSGGEQQMLAIARAMMSRPGLLLLDEPSTGLAPALTEQVFVRLAEINQRHRTAMLVVEQNAERALSVAARAFVLESGRIALSGSASELRADDRVRQAYLSV